MNKDFLLKGNTAAELYRAVKDLPIVDYHCHLSPKEIYEDKPFLNIGEMWLAGDHYKWRLMRLAGIDEKYITGDADYDEKFLKYAEALQFAAGNPLYHWSHMELSQFFGIDEYLTAKNAARILKTANEYIKKNRLSPRKLIKNSNVSYIATTDDITDSLEYHKKISEDKSFDTVVAPSFRTDNLLLIRRNGYKDYIEKLSKVSGVSVRDLAALKQAVIKRLDFFCESGCKFTDVGIEYFPNCVADEKSADSTFRKSLSGDRINDDEYMGFLGNMYLFLAKEYKKRNLVMQMHLAVKRNANSEMFEKLGADVGVDCVGDVLSVKDMSSLFDKINSDGGLPETVLYTLNPYMTTALSVLAASFRNIRLGAAWWFCDHKRGIADVINVIAETMNLGVFLGMLTDSRSFLSYARHDYFRRILCTVLGEWADGGEYNPDLVQQLAEKICYFNVNQLIKGE